MHPHCTGQTHKTSYFEYWSHLVAHSLVLVPARLAVLPFESGLVERRWGHCRGWLIPSCVPAATTLEGTLPSCSLCWFLLVGPKSIHHGSSWRPWWLLMGKEFNQCRTLENSIRRRDIEDQGGKHQLSGLQSDWQRDEINNVWILGCSASWFQI